MPHADSALIPPSVTDKKEFWALVKVQLAALIEGQTNWVTILANASALVYHSLQSFPSHFGSNERAVNWCGFYLTADLFPGSQSTQTGSRVLLLGPFCGKPACQLIKAESGKGVCADAFVNRQILVIPDVDAYPGHIACDGETKSEIVLPLIVKRGEKGIAVGVMDLDCLALKGFNEDDAEGLKQVIALIVQSCDWNI